METRPATGSNPGRARSRAKPFTRSPLIRSYIGLVLASLALASCQDVPSPVEPAREATLLAAVSPTVAVGVVGTATENLPEVVARDVDGNPVAGVTVTFSVMDGFGEISGKVVTSDSDGVARLISWRLGVLAGRNTVSATSGSLSPVSFHIDAVAGPPTSIRMVAGDQQIGAPGTTTPVRPQTRVVDQFGNAVAGVPVTFAVTSGGGSLTGESATTDSAGLATVGSWRLGSRGDQSITANSGVLSPVTFTALAIAFAPCATDNVLPEGITVNAALTGESCTNADGSFQERIRVNVSQPGAFQFNLSSGDFNAYLELIGADLIGGNDDRGTSTNSSIKALLPTGVYTLVVSSSTAGAIGAYSLSYTRVSDSVEGCEEAFVVKGIVASQTTGPNDCTVTQNAQADRFQIFLRAGSTVTIEAEDLSYSYHVLSLSKPSGEILATATSAGYVDTVIFTALADSYYRIDVGNAGENGAQYILRVK